ncbi:MAG: hypothetical protein J1E81_06000 [Eubacterium sp.]|nr:hypothetical protein [Eubacterium sp.]
MRPLTIEELKALPKGEWVWVVEIGYTGNYHRVHSHHNICITTVCERRYCYLKYSDYGTKWSAYKNKEIAEAEEYKIDFDEQGGWEVRKYIPAHYQPWCMAESKEEAENIIKQLRGEK